MEKVVYHISCSSTLHDTDVSETGRSFEAWCLSPFLKSGTMLAFFQPDGT